MFRLKDTRHQNTASFLSSAIQIAEHFGFEAISDAPSRSIEQTPPRDVRRRIPSAAECEEKLLLARRDERSLVSSARRCLLRAKDGEAQLLWRLSAAPAREPATALELHVIGTGEAIAEALLIIVAYTIAEDAGITERTLSINSIGSPDSSNRFLRDIGLYLRKHIESISPTLRPRIVSDPLGTLIQLIEKGHPAAPRAPQSMEYLTEEERRKFWDLLEYLEVFGLPYELNPHVLGSRDCWAHSLYELSTVDQETGERVQLASGGRYDPLAQLYTPGRSAAMISIPCEVRGKSSVKRDKQPSVNLYFAHLGPEARRRSLSVMELLRKGGVRVRHSLCFDRIGEQMAVARRFSIPYILIMGHKEAMEGTILVREVATNSQDAIPLPELTQYLRRKRYTAVA